MPEPDRRAFLDANVLRGHLQTDVLLRVDNCRSANMGRHTLPDMDVMPSRPEVFLMANSDRRLMPGGPALIGPDGVRREIPPKVYEVMQFVEAAMLEGYAVQVTPLRSELPIDEAADAVEMDGDELRLYASRGDIPFRSSEYVDWVHLADVLALNARVNAEREQALQAFAEEEPWDDNGSTTDR
jgi:hypothetical protein